MAEDYGIKSRVSYIGFLQRSTVLEHMKKCVAFINTPTYGEPFAGTILEAMSSGAPLLTSDNGSSLEVVSHEINALVHTGQDYSGLARNMRRIITDKDFATLISKNAMNHVSSHFNKDQIMKTTIDLLTKIAYEK
jgi:glycosyltransferase involved in cell wall biosynthesis